MLQKENIGAKLAELDLLLRGPGEVMGIKQHGIPRLKLADLTELKLIQKTKNYAQKIIKKSPHLDLFPNLKRKMADFYNKTVPG